MKRFIYYLFACVAALGLFSSCDKEEEERDNTYLTPALESENLTLEEEEYGVYSCEVPYEARSYRVTFKNEVLHPGQVQASYSIYYRGNLSEPGNKDWASVEIHNEETATCIDITLNKNPNEKAGRSFELTISAEYNGQTSSRKVNIFQQAAPPPPQDYQVFDVDYTLTTNTCRIHDGKYKSTITTTCNLNHKETLTFIIMDDPEKAFIYFPEDNTYDPSSYYYLNSENGAFSIYYLQGKKDIWLKDKIPGFANLHGCMLLRASRDGNGSLRFWTCNHCTCQKTSLEQNYTYVIIDFGANNSDGVSTSVTKYNERTINVTKPTITKKERPSIPDHCTHYVDTGGDDDEQGGNVQTGTTTAVVSVTTNYWDAWLEFIQGKSFQVEWKYYPNTGKYYFYGGPYCQDPEANGGKGVLYECHKGYNNIEICRGKDYYGSFWSIWYVYAKFTI